MGMQLGSARTKASASIASIAHFERAERNIKKGKTTKTDTVTQRHTVTQREPHVVTYFKLKVELVAHLLVKMPALSLPPAIVLTEIIEAAEATAMRALTLWPWRPV